MKATVDIDIGGTFTDCFVRTDGKQVWCKTRTTAYDLAIGMNEAIREAARRLQISVEELLAQSEVIRYSTTLAMNKLIERKGPNLALITTEGFEDTLLIGKGSQWADGMPLKFQRNIARVNKPDPLIPKEMTIGVKERVDSAGKAIRPLDERDFLSKLQRLVDRGARGFVVCLLWSFLNPIHEKRIKALIEQEYPDSYLGNMPVLLSSEVSPRVWEYTRTTTTVLNAYLHQSMYEELAGVGEELRELGYKRPLMMVHNTGGMAVVFRTSAVNTYNGGPVAGLMGSAFLGKLYGYDNVICTDMGGTSFDIGMVVEGSTRFYKFHPVIDRWLVDTTILDTRSIGAGGGSIARVNPLLANRLEVGPESAGSNPGPAAYDQGGEEPTITDADIVLGYINPDYFHGGKLKLNRERAERAIKERIARPLGLEAEEAAFLIKKIVDANMGAEIYKETVLKGYDPRDYILFAFGGAGPTHCAGYGSNAQVNKIVIFPFSSTFCAFGSSTMDIMHIYEKSKRFHLIHPTTMEYFQEYEEFNAVVRELQELAARDIRGEGFPMDQVTFSLELDMKFGGQLNVKRVASPRLFITNEQEAKEIYRAFEVEYAQAYSPMGLNPEAGVEIENFILKAILPQPKPQFPSLVSRRADPKRAQVGVRLAYWDELGGLKETCIYRQELLEPGNTLEGPAVIEAEDTTIVVAPGWRYSIDRFANGVMDRL